MPSINLIPASSNLNNYDLHNLASHHKAKVRGIKECEGDVKGRIKKAGKEVKRREWKERKAKKYF